MGTSPLPTLPRPMLPCTLAPTLRRLTLAGLAPLLGFAGCDAAPTACTLIGCSDAYVVSLDPIGEALAAGRYEVSIAAGEETRSCAFTVATDATVVRLADESVACPSIYAVDGSKNISVQFEPVEGRVAVVVVRDEAAVAGAVVMPAYEPQFLNGVDCGATCEVARTEIAVE